MTGRGSSRAALVVAAIVLIVMTVALAYGCIAGSFWSEGAVLMSMPWGVISVIDVYSGGALFTGWIAFRERSWMRTTAWAAAIVLLGNFATSMYAVAAAVDSGGDWRRFWLGRTGEPR
jgi:hypothetical protein